LVILKPNILEKFLFSFNCSLLNCFNYVIWEFGLHYKIIMKIVFDVFSTSMTSMTIKYTKYLYFRPISNFWCFCWRLDHIQNYGYPIFICFSYSSYICICWKTSNCAKLFWGHLWLLKLLQGCWLFYFTSCNKFLNLLL